LLRNIARCLGSLHSFHLSLRLNDRCFATSNFSQRPFAVIAGLTRNLLTEALSNNRSFQLLPFITGIRRCVYR